MTIILDFVPSDFEKSFSPDECAITLATKRQLGWKNPSTGHFFVTNSLEDMKSPVYAITNVKLNDKVISTEGFYTQNYNEIKGFIATGKFKSASVYLTFKRFLTNPIDF